MSEIAIDPKFEFLMPFDTNLRRVGADNDGGYLIPDICLENARAVISLGVDDDWSFEQHWSTTNPSVSIHSYDDLDLTRLKENGYQSLMGFFTGDRIFYNQRVVNRDNAFVEFYHDVKGVDWPDCHGHDDFPKLPQWIQDECVDLHKLYQYLPFLKNHSGVEMPEILQRIQHDEIFLKMDIEGSEYQLIGDVCQNSQRIIGLAIEFHEVGGANHERFVRAISDLQERYHIVHVHGNNYSRVTQCSLPDVLEITFIRKDLLAPTVKKKNLYELGLDHPNNPKKEDYQMYFH